MKHTLFLICGLFLTTAYANEQSKTQVVGNAEITKIDAKKKSLQVREVATSTTAPRRGQGGGGGAGGGGGRTGGGRRGGGRRGGGVGFPGGGGGRRPGSSTNQPKEYKVFVTKDTVMQFAGVNIDFSSLHVGDRISVEGTPKGSKGDLEATTVTRQ